MERARFFFVVNIITKEGAERPGVHYSLEAGDFNTNKGLLTFGKRYQNGADLLLSGSYTESGGQTLYFPEYDDGNAANNGGYAEGTDGESVYAISGTLRHNALQIDAILFERGKEIPIGTYSQGLVFNNKGVKTYDKRYFLELKYRPQLARNLGFLLRFYYDWYGYKDTSLTRNSSIQVVSNRTRTEGGWYGSELQLDVTPLTWNRLIMGIELQAHDDLLKNIDEYLATTDLSRREQFQLYSVHLQEEIRLRRNLILTGGARLDYYKDYLRYGRNRATPRLTLLYEPDERGVIKFLYGQAFRVPNSYEYFYCGGSTGYVCNPDLRSEINTTYEIVAERRLGAYFLGSVSLYRYDIKDLITEIPAGANQMFVNLNRVRSAGIETEIEDRSPSGLKRYMIYT